MYKGACGFEPCEHQEIFHIRMCTSYQCTECTSQYCMDTCQDIQAMYPVCRCHNWPAARETYSDGQQFRSAGKFGDVGDYA
jgi:hypothetical protein